jgi:hypothetical protein
MATGRRENGLTSATYANQDQHFEQEQSVYMNQLIDEIHYKCLPGQFFPPNSIYKTFSQLALLKYKNTELIPAVRGKILAMLNGTDTKPDKNFDVFEKILKDKAGREPGHDVYRGFDNSKEFYSHFETLLSWQSEEEIMQKAISEAENIEGGDKKDVTEILEIMQHILKAGTDLQSYQREMAESIESVRSQYTQISESFDQHKFLQDNKYIKHDLIQLQEKMVEGGLLDPYESIGAVELENIPMSERMGRATEIFYDLTKDYFPEMAPKINHLFEFDDQNASRKDSSLSKIERQNDFSLKYIGLVLGKIAETRHTVRRDVVDNDFCKCPKSLI